MRIACSGLIALFALCFSSAHAQVETQDAAPQWSLAIHGGAGVIERSSLTPEQDAAYRAALQGALDDALAAIRQRLQAFQPQLRPREVGTVASVSIKSPLSSSMSIPVRACPAGSRTAI